MTDERYRIKAMMRVLKDHLRSWRHQPITRPMRAEAR